MTLTDQITEARLLAALICEPEVLAAGCDVETDDFTGYRHRCVFMAIRQLQHEGADVGVLEIDDWMRQHDERLATDRQAKAGAAFIGVLALDTEPYGHAVLWEHDIAWLRELRRRRQMLEVAA